jgi:erythromycin esterase-like protein
MFEAMTQDIRDFVDAAHEIVGLGEPSHREPAFGRVRNELFAQLVEFGFRSFALESDRVAAFAVDDFVREGTGTLDSAMDTGFSHGFGALDPNRELVEWMREYNDGRPAAERLAFHGIDAALEFTAASPRADLEHARDRLGLDLDLAPLVGDDERWSRTEAVTDPAASPGDTPEAHRLRAIADDMLALLHVRAPELIASTSLTEWHRTRARLTSALGLLRYHRQAAQRGEDAERWARLCALRDSLMARNLLDIREIEARRGPTLVFANNVHLQRNRSRMTTWHGEITWHGTGAVVSSLLGERYTVIAGSLGRSEGLGLLEPEPGTAEHALQDRFPGWGLTAAEAVEPAATRSDTAPEQGYFPLDRHTLEGVDAVLHIGQGAASGLSD